MTEQDTMTLDEAEDILCGSYPSLLEAEALNYIITQARLAQRYKTALELYANRTFYQKGDSVYPEIVYDAGNTAHKALEEK